MAVPSFWSVERDGGTVIATCPEPLRYPSDDDTPGWMGNCAAAIREELTLLGAGAGTLLEATLYGTLPSGADLESVLLYNVGVPAAQVHAGVRLRRLPPGGAGAEQRYRRVPHRRVESRGGRAAARGRARARSRRRGARDRARRLAGRRGAP